MNNRQIDLRNIIALFILAITASTLLGCQRADRQRLHVVFLPDLTGSVEQHAEQDLFAAIETTAGELQRGDQAAVVPITGDASNDDEGHIVRWHISEVKQPFDGDLHRLASEEHSRLTALRDDTLRRPFQQTDILGAVNLAAEELTDDPPATVKAIVILSDFIQCDSRYDFDMDQNLERDESAIRLATWLASNSRRFEGVRVYLGSLASHDLRQLSWRRRSAIRAFWTALFGTQGGRTEWASDGPGRLPQFLAALRDANPYP